MTQETKDMIVLLQLEFSAEIEQADHDPKYSYRIFQRKTGNPIYQACRFSDMFRFFNIGPSMKIEDIDTVRRGLHSTRINSLKRKSERYSQTSDLKSQGKLQNTAYPQQRATQIFTAIPHISWAFATPARLRR